MTDNKENRDGRDRSKVDGSENYELQYVAEKMGVTMEEVRKAIEAVGNNRDKIETYLTTKKGRA